MSRAVALLARREHGRVELARKLQRYVQPDGDPAEVERVLDALTAQGLLSDARFAGSLARARRDRYGDARVRHDLRERGVEPAAAAAALAALSGTELARARALWQRRFGTRASTRDEWARQGRFLQARGFSMATISAVLGRAGRAAYDCDPSASEGHADDQD